MSKLPNGWALTSLGDLASYINGKGFKKSEWKSEGIPIIRIQNLNKLKSEFNYGDESHEDRYRVKNGDLLVAWSASLGAYIWNRGDAWLNQHIFRADHDCRLVDKQYLYYSIKNSIESLYGKTHGMGMVHVTKGKFEDHEVVLPPINEQTRIANKLDSLLAKVEVAQTRLEKIPSLLKRFRQSVLAAATSGALTKEWRDNIKEYPNLKVNLKTDYELQLNASETKPQIRKVNDVFENIEEVLMPDMNIPSSWMFCNLAKLCQPFSYGTSTKSASEGEIPVLRMGNIQGLTLDWEKLVYTSDKKEIEKYLLKAGDVLFNRTNSPELVGKAAIYKDEQKAIYAGYLIKVSCRELLIPEYVNYVLNSPYGKYYAWSVKTDGVSQSNINAQKLGLLAIPLPCVDEQKEIVRRVESLFALADTVEKQYLDAKKRTDKLTQSILAKAFKGELVPQDPNDESAEKLLERIKDFRKQASQKQPKKKRAANKPKKKQVKTMKLDDAPNDYLTRIIKKNDNKMWADELWKASNLSIDDFYEKLCQEVDDSLLIEAFDEPEDNMTEKRYLIAC